MEIKKNKDLFKESDFVVFMHMSPNRQEAIFGPRGKNLDEVTGIFQLDRDGNLVTALYSLTQSQLIDRIDRLFEQSVVPDETFKALDAFSPKIGMRARAAYAEAIRLHFEPESAVILDFPGRSLV